MIGFITYVGIVRKDLYCWDGCKTSHFVFLISRKGILLKK
jgi:hypothetical protein